MKKNNINTQYVFTKNNTVFINNKEEEKWYPINFQWIPVFKLKQEMTQQNL